ncbi:hypothetical protein OHR68_25155 [Spirillospora sp. NBC_00431]
MQVGIKLGVGAAAVVLAGSALSVGAVAGASEPPPNPGVDESVPAQPQPTQDEEGYGPGAIYVGPEGAAKAMERLEHRDNARPRWCNGTVVVRGLRIRNGPGLRYKEVGELRYNAHITTDWNSTVKRDGYLWVPLHGTEHRWIADYKIDEKKWYVKYHGHC